MTTTQTPIPVGQRHAFVRATGTKICRQLVTRSTGVEQCGQTYESAIHDIAPE